ncbi:nuclear transport factor 2 family protein [Actinomadura harenae]|uniref:Nuclear transport factor 2 family protein n=1 Tax=Actinomadura harenae TaxID=2483351 RepID=A0A3M2M7Z3_9ACTN|nr:nuclear transport factor 2 family protein [Actinomadura harenae]RMI44675.1 nuclear transport factor 2 family protein [Actinomadura harenae]
MALQDLTAEARLTALADRAELVTLLDRYARALDDRTFDPQTLAALFTPDATVSIPREEHTGLTDLSRYLADSLATFGRSQHIYAGHLVDVNGDEASLRVNSNATYVLLGTERVYITGSVVTGTAVRTPYGWRLKLLTLTPTWDTLATFPTEEKDDDA